MPISTSLLAGVALALGCATRSVPTSYSINSPASPDSPASAQLAPTSFSDAQLTAHDERAAASPSHEPAAPPHDHSRHSSPARAKPKHDHSKHDHDHASHARSKHGPHHSTEVSHAEHGASEQNSAETTKYVCPMHPEEVSSEPGRCSICGMNLEPAK